MGLVPRPFYCGGHIYYLWLDVTPLLREIVHKVGPVANGREADAVVLRGRVLVWDMKKDEPSNVNELLPDAIKPPTISLAHRLPKEVSFTFS